MFFSSVKEINRLISKGMSNIYLKVTFAKNCRSRNFDFRIFKKVVSRSVFEELQLAQADICQALGAKLCVAFLLLWLWKELWSFKVKESMHFVEQKYKLW